MYSKQAFPIRTPLGFISVFRLTALLKIEITVLNSLAFIASSFKVTEESLAHPLSFELLLLLKELTFIVLSYILSLITRMQSEQVQFSHNTPEFIFKDVNFVFEIPNNSFTFGTFRSSKLFYEIKKKELKLNLLRY